MIRTSSQAPLSNSPLVVLPSFRSELRDIDLYCKRDDLFGFTHSAITGNKARKLVAYVDFNHGKKRFTSKSPIVPFSPTAIVSYGSHQSNAMVALSELAILYRIPFYYYTKSLPRSLRSKATVYQSTNKEQYNLLTNYERAQVNGMKTIVKNLNSNLKEIHSFMKQNHPDAWVFMEGAVSTWVEEGYKILAEELKRDIINIKNSSQKKWSGIDIVLTAGTGVSGYFLSRCLTKLTTETINQLQDIRIFVFPVIPMINSSDNHYSNNYIKNILEVLNLKFEKRYHPEELYPLYSQREFYFSRPHPILYEMHLELKKKTGITFDLVYDALGWLTLIQNYKVFRGRVVIYIHQGGLSGNISMLQRYTYAGIHKSSKLW